MAKKQYLRHFCAMQQDSNGFSHNGKEPFGYCTIEFNNQKGKLTLQVQNLKPKTFYKVFIIHAQSTGSLGFPVDSLAVDDKGNGSIKWEFFPDEYDFPFYDFNAVAVLAPNTNLSMKSTEVVSPLVGYRNTNVRWKDTFVAFQKETVALKKTVKPAENIDKAQSDFHLPKTGQMPDSEQLLEVMERKPLVSDADTNSDTNTDTHTNTGSDAGKDAEQDLAKGSDKETQSASANDSEMALKNNLPEEGEIKKQELVFDVVLEPDQEDESENRELNEGKEQENKENEASTPCGKKATKNQRNLEQELREEEEAVEEGKAEEEKEAEEEEKAAESGAKEESKNSETDEIKNEDLEVSKQEYVFNINVENGISEDQLEAEDKQDFKHPRGTQERQERQEQQQEVTEQEGKNEQEENSQEDEETEQEENCQEDEETEQEENCQEDEETEQEENCQENEENEQEENCQENEENEQEENCQENEENEQEDEEEQEKSTQENEFRDKISDKLKMQQASCLCEEQVKVKFEEQPRTEFGTQPTIRHSENDHTYSFESKIYYNEGDYINEGGPDGTEPTVTPSLPQKPVGDGSNHNQGKEATFESPYEVPDETFKEAPQKSPCNQLKPGAEAAPESEPGTVPESKTETEAEAEAEPRVFPGAGVEEVQEELSSRKKVNSEGADEKAFGYQFQEQDAKTHEKLPWRKQELEDIFKNNLVMKPFENQIKNIRWVRIALYELVALPFDYRFYMNNSFISLAYKKYKHLILGECMENGDKHYVLGVPELYDIGCLNMALEMGFVQFKCCEDKLPVTGIHGYWLLPIRKQ